MKKSLKRSYIGALFLAGFCFVTLPGSCVHAQEAVISNGIFIEGIDVGGMTEQEASDCLLYTSRCV